MDNLPSSFLSMSKCFGCGIKQCCKPPKPPTKKSKVYLRESFEYVKNQAKWKAARAYCEHNNMEFKLITEKELGKY